MSQKNMPNMTGLDPAQLHVLKTTFEDVQKVLQSLERRMAAGALPAVPPEMILLTAITAVLSGAKHWDVPGKDLLSNHLASACETEAEAVEAVKLAFAGRAAAEALSGVSHGPEPEPPPVAAHAGEPGRPPETAEEFVDGLIARGELPSNHTRESLIENLVRNGWPKSAGQG